MNLPELVSPERAQQWVIWAAIALSIIGATLGFWRARSGGLVAALGGPLVFGLWVFHNWITRYDPRSGYFGLNKVWVLALEMVIFVALGIVSGLVWNRVRAFNNREK